MWWLLASIWCLIYVGHAYINRPSSPLLPAYSNTSSRHLPARGGYGHIKTSLRFLQFRVTLTSWNAAHDRLSSVLFKLRKSTLVGLLERFYDVGSVLGIAGMFIAVLVLLRVSSSSGWALIQKINKPEQAHMLMRRNFDDAASLQSKPDATFGGLGTITPIIPGYTVPSSHLPTIILAVFISQAIHEVGHAIAAALSSIPLLAAGASLTVIIPAAFVSFSTSALSALRPSARGRIIAAGAYHNLVFWLLLAFIAWSGVLRIVSAVSGYTNISDVGKAVVRVNADSPLSLHLAPGDIITKLDDTPASEWAVYLATDEHELEQGWCLQNTVLGKTDECCHARNHSPLACFSARGSSYRGCLDPIPILTQPTNHERCTTPKECQTGETCVFPEKKAQLLRLTLKDDRVVLWSGPASEVLEEVHVDDWLPRISLLPRGLPTLLATFWEYLQMATLSLFFFNLLPLPFLDGSELLSALLDLMTETEDAFSFDIEALETGRGGIGARSSRARGFLRGAKGHIKSYVPWGTLGVVIMCSICSIANALL